MNSLNKHPLVSIVIPTYNYSAYIGTAIRSCLEQRHQPVEVIVVDDGSTDGTSELIQKEFGDKVDYLYQSNQGVSSARNRGLARAKGEFIIFLDADDYLTPDAVTLRLGPMQENLDIGIVITQNYTREENCTHLRYRPKRKTDQIAANLYKALLLKRISFATCAAMMRTDIARRFEFPTRISNGEDVAFFTKILFSTKTYYLAKPTAVVLKHSDSQRYNIEKIKKQNMNLVMEIFDDPFYGGRLEPLRKDFTSGRFLSLSRSMYLSDEKHLARQFYLEGICAKPINILKLNYLTKFLRCWI
ncbi:MAG: glycosyltransferase family 2 protein [Phycisphaerae bacterium]|jgi:glycosyltransferase involved in cell wall biosynthesis|nr:glycosyltransferase family 2 protein [Phycisphaerae bacterium]